MFLSVKFTWQFHLLCICFFAIFIHNYCFSQPRRPLHKFSPFYIPEGISQSSIQSLTQDKEGFIWFGTEDGLNRFDGYEISQFFPIYEDTTSLIGRSIFTLFNDSKSRMWVGTKKGPCIYNPKSETFTRIPEVEKFPIKPDRKIYSFTEDENGVVWAGTRNGIIRLGIDSEVKDIVYYKIPEIFSQNRSLSARVIQYLGNNILLIGSSWGLLKFDISEKVFKKVSEFHDTTLLSELTSRSIYSVSKGSNKSVWVGGNTDLFQLNFKDSSIKKYQVFNHSLENRKYYREVRVTFEDRYGNLWVGTSNGLFYFDQVNTTFSKVPQSSGYSINTILEDKIGSLWIGAFVGISRSDISEKAFFLYDRKTFTSISEKFPQVRAIFEDQKGNIWLGVGGKGLTLITKDSFEIKTFPEIFDPKREEQTEINAIYEDQLHNMWIGSENGLLLLDSSYQLVHRFYFNNQSEHTGENRIRGIEEGDAGIIWIITRGGGLIRLDPQTREFQRFLPDSNDPHSISDKSLRSIRIGRSGLIWIGTERYGVDKMISDANHPSGYRFIHYSFEENCISHNQVNSIWEDKKGILWIGTYGGGLSRFDPIEETLIQYREKPHNPMKDIIYGVIEDEKERLWLSSNAGLIVFDKEKEAIFRYEKEDGIQYNEFNSGVCFKGQSGRLHFGGIAGFNSFFPDSISRNASCKPIVFTDLVVFSSSGREETNNPFLPDEHINFVETLRLPYNLSTFSIEFSALNFFYSDRTQYAYYLEGQNKNWINQGNKRTVTFNNLSSGHYKLHVVGYNNDDTNILESGCDTESRILKIVILPPWYKTWWAFSIWAFLGGIIILSIFLTVFRIRDDQHKLIQLEKLDQIYSNITHEFGTPLTLILRQVHQIVSSGLDRRNESPYWESALNSIEYNARYLAQMVDQMMKLAKGKFKELKANYRLGDIIEFTRDLTYSFLPVAKVKSQKLYFESSSNRFDTWFDSEKVQIILFNLLSNALKYTHEEGIITLSIHHDESNIYIRVEDNGPGIPKEKREKVFEKFYRLKRDRVKAKPGIGIGLPVAYELTQLLDGTISILDPQNSQGTLFKVTIPIKYDIESSHVDDNIENNSIYTPSVSLKPTKLLSPRQKSANEIEPFKILIVEDHPEMRTVLINDLPENFMILEAINGAEGLQLARKEIPDLIICDIIMPEMDGFVFSRKIKEEILTSHIPLILLTALKEDEYKYQGLELGTDAFLSKPYEKRELNLTIQMLLNVRQKLQHYHWLRFLSEPAPEEPVDSNTKFINTLKAFLEDNYQDPSLMVKNLCQELGFSQSQLERKIKALTGHSPKQHIQIFRLKKARDFLGQNPDNISQIAYDVGFNDPGYFSKCFKAHFGVSPRDASK